MGTPSANTRLGQVMDDEGRKLVWLSRRIEVDAATLSRYTRGLHVPELRRVAIAATLGRELEELFDEQGNHLPPAEVAAR